MTKQKKIYRKIIKNYKKKIYRKIIKINWKKKENLNKKCENMCFQNLK